MNNNCRYKVGIHEIDEEHQQLFDCLDEMLHAAGNNQGHAKTLAALDKLQHYTQTHFRVEECVMRLFDYPDFAAHKARHDDFIEELGEMRERAKSEDITPLMVSFLLDWLVNHIQSVDTRYVAYFKQKGGEVLRFA